MLKNRTINLGVIKTISRALGDLNAETVYVGGAVVSLYADDPAANDVRPTKDVDLTLEISSFSDLEKLREELNFKGFVQRAESDVTCRFWYNDIMVDVMSTKPVGWAPSNDWFEPGFEHLISIQLKDAEIRLLSFPFFLATKYSAFNNRGGDSRTSKDFEDITYLLDYRTTLVEDVLQSPTQVREYLVAEFRKLESDPGLKEGLLSHLFYESQTERHKMIMDKVNRIIKSS